MIGTFTTQAQDRDRDNVRTKVRVRVRVRVRVGRGQGSSDKSELRRGRSVRDIICARAAARDMRDMQKCKSKSEIGADASRIVNGA